MKVLLINPGSDTVATAGRYRRFLSPMPPISLAYVAASLERAGFPVEIFEDFIASQGNPDAVFDHVRDTRPDVVGISGVTATAPRSFDIGARIKRQFPDIKVIFGNIHPSIFYEDFLIKSGADAVVMGEGEVSTPNLIRAIADGDALSGVRGIAYRDGGEVRVTEPEQFITDLDRLPFPAWHLFPLERYRIFNFARVREPGTLVLGSRGCPYNCNYCSLKIMGRRRRRRSPENIAAEFEHLFNLFGYVQPSFIDPIFPFSKEEGLAFSRCLIARGLHKKVTWITETRVDLVDEELLCEMAHAGLSRIMYGFETGSQEGIESINKSTTLGQARRTVAMTRKAGIQIIGFFMLGVPGDTEASIDQTIRFASMLKIDFAKFTVFSPFPGTKIYEELREQGKLPDSLPWESYTSYPSREIPAAYIPEGLTNGDIMRLQKKAFFNFYLRPRAIFNHLFRIRSLRIRDMVDGLMTLLKN